MLDLLTSFLLLLVKLFLITTEASLDFFELRLEVLDDEVGIGRLLRTDFVVGRCFAIEFSLQKKKLEI